MLSLERRDIHLLAIKQVHADVNTEREHNSYLVHKIL